MNVIHKNLTRSGYVREPNGGGTHVWTKKVGLWIVSVCNGAANEPGACDTRIHVNAHHDGDCEKFFPGYFVRTSRLRAALALTEKLVEALSRDQELP